MRISDWSSDVCSSDLFGYGELSLPFVSPSNSLPLVNKFQLVGAFRFEDHRGIDQVTTPKVGVVYSPSNGVDFKASWGKSFKVPTLYKKIGRAYGRERVGQYE